MTGAMAPFSYLVLKELMKTKCEFSTIVRHSDPICPYSHAKYTSIADTFRWELLYIRLDSLTSRPNVLQLFTSVIFECL
jgi:hypothetical protein